MTQNPAAPSEGETPSMQFWRDDKPSSVQQALELLRYGSVQSGDGMESDATRAAGIRTERRMLACADFLERQLAATTAELDAAKVALAIDAETITELKYRIKFLEALQ